MVERTNSANLARQAQSNGEPSRWLLCRKSDAARTKKPRQAGSGAKLVMLVIMRGPAKLFRRTASPPSQRGAAASVAQRPRPQTKAPQGSGAKFFQTGLPNASNGKPTNTIAQVLVSPRARKSPAEAGLSRSMNPHHKQSDKQASVRRHPRCADRDRVSPLPR